MELFLTGFWFRDVCVLGYHATGLWLENAEAVLSQQNAEYGVQSAERTVPPLLLLLAGDRHLAEPSGRLLEEAVGYGYRSSMVNRRTPPPKKNKEVRMVVRAINRPPLRGLELRMRLFTLLGPSLRSRTVGAFVYSLA